MTIIAQIAGLAVGLFVVACVAYGAWTARADRAYLDWASDETDWRR